MLLFVASIPYNSHYSDPAHFSQIFCISKTHSEILVEALKHVLVQFGVENGFWNQAGQGLNPRPATYQFTALDTPLNLLVPGF